MTQEQEIALLKSEVEWRNKRIARQQEIMLDLAGELDRLWHEKCTKCGEDIAA